MTHIIERDDDERLQVLEAKTIHCRRNGVTPQLLKASSLIDVCSRLTRHELVCGKKHGTTQNVQLRKFGRILELLSEVTLVYQGYPRMNMAEVSIDDGLKRAIGKQFIHNVRLNMFMIVVFEASSFPLVGLLAVWRYRVPRGDALRTADKTRQIAGQC